MEGMEPPSRMYSGFLPLGFAEEDVDGGLVEEGNVGSEMDKSCTEVAREVWSEPLVRICVVAGVGFKLGLVKSPTDFEPCLLAVLMLGRLDSPIGPQTSIIAFSSVWNISLSGFPSHGSAWLSIVIVRRLCVSSALKFSLIKAVKVTMMSSTSWFGTNLNDMAAEA